MFVIQFYEMARYYRQRNFVSYTFWNLLLRNIIHEITVWLLQPRPPYKILHKFNE